MKNAKKVLSCFLALLMVMTCAFSTAYAEEETTTAAPAATADAAETVDTQIPGLTDLKGMVVDSLRKWSEDTSFEEKLKEHKDKDITLQIAVVDSFVHESTATVADALEESDDSAAQVNETLRQFPRVNRWYENADEQERQALTAVSKSMYYTSNAAIYAGVAAVCAVAVVIMVPFVAILGPSVIGQLAVLNEIATRKDAAV